MAQSQVQIQKQEQSLKQTQAFSQQQLLQAQLVELPVMQLIDRINTEMNDNPALENDPQGDFSDRTETDNAPDTDTNPDNEDYDTATEREERLSALDEALSSIGRDDEDLPAFSAGNSYRDEEREEMVYGNTLSFYDQLKEQMGEINLTEKETTIMEYLVGTLDDDGLLRKPLDLIADELAIYFNIDTTVKEIEKVLGQLQDFDPAGIGARSLQECLLLQVKRKPSSKATEIMTTILKRHFDDFTKKRWDRIAASLQLTRIQTEAVIGELRKLNPKPGSALGEVTGRSLQHIIPDFIIDTQDDGTVTFSLNQAEVPELRISQSFTDTLKQYQSNPAGMSRQMKEALLYTKKKVDAAKGFIEAIKVRQQTLTTTMKAIIRWQHKYFEEGDETLLRPMILKDIAEQTGLDISTISRVSNSKYAQTHWGTFPLRHFFSDSFVAHTGEEVSTRQVKLALRDIIDAEDKSRPYNDDELKDLLARQGFPIARRTVAKYREMLDIPIARLRKN